MELSSTLSIAHQGQTLGNPRHIALLEAVAQTGSISQAAKVVGVSYKTAWDSIEAMNQLAGAPLVLRAVGGKGGGGATLSEQAQRLVHNYRHIEAEHQRFLTALQQQAHSLVDDYILLRRLTMRTSARNQFAGKVLSIQQGTVNDEVVIAAGAIQIVAVVTHDSVVSLGLQPGSEVVALVKASSIILAADDGGRYSARNALRGHVEVVHTGAVNSEVLVEVGGGLRVAVVVTNTSTERLELMQGQPVLALFKASSVLLAVPA